MKKPLVIFIAIILFFINVTIIYDSCTATYKIIDDTNHSVIINGNKYRFTGVSWRYSEIDKRIGYMENEPRSGRIFYHFLPMGLYSIKNDEQNLFYQIHKFMTCINYFMLAREDVDLTAPEIGDVTKIECGDKTITDVEVITAVMNLYHKVGDVEISEPELPARDYILKVYDKRYPGVYFSIDLLQYYSESKYWTTVGDSWIQIGSGEYVKIPNELMPTLMD